MSNPGSQIRGTSPQPRTVSPGGAPLNNLNNDARKYQPPGTSQPIIAPGPPPPTTAQTYTGPAWHPQTQGLLARPANQTLYTNYPPPQGIQYRNTAPGVTVTPPPGYNRAPIYSVPPSQSQGYIYPPTSGGYYYDSHVGSRVGGVYPGYGYTQTGTAVGGAYQGYGYSQGYSQPRQSERRVTYHPYTRYYTDYEQQVTMVPVEKVRTKYYQKVFEINYVPKAVEQVIMQVKPVEKKHMKVEYIPVEKKIIHLPQDERWFQLNDPEKHPELYQKMQEKGIGQPNSKPLTSNPSQTLLNLQNEKVSSGQPYSGNQNYGANQKYNQKGKGTIRESQVEEVYSSARNDAGERDKYTIKVN